MNTKILLKELTTMTDKHLGWLSKLETLSEQQLNERIAPESWSTLECLEHLNRYGDFYIPEVKRRLSNAGATSQRKFKSGWLGNYFALSMLPKEKLNKMKTFKSMNPIHSSLNKNTLYRLKEQLLEWKEIFEDCEKADLTRIKTSISISKLIKLRLGDTLRVVVNHNERHMEQVKKILESLRIPFPATLFQH